MASALDGDMPQLSENLEAQDSSSSGTPNGPLAHTRELQRAEIVTPMSFVLAESTNARPKPTLKRWLLESPAQEPWHNFSWSIHKESLPSFSSRDSAEADQMAVKSKGATVSVDGDIDLSDCRGADVAQGFRAQPISNDLLSSVSSWTGNFQLPLKRDSQAKDIQAGESNLSQVVSAVAALKSASALLNVGSKVEIWKAKKLVSMVKMPELPEMDTTEGHLLSVNSNVSYTAETQASVFSKWPTSALDTLTATDQELIPHREQFRDFSRTLVHKWLDRWRRSSTWDGTIRVAGQDTTNAEGDRASTARDAARLAGVLDGFVSNGHTQRAQKRRAGEQASDDEGSNFDGPRRTEIDAEDSATILWACPYPKHDPLKYSLRRGCKCSMHMLRSIPRLKQHLKLNHCAPQYYCQRCSEVFSGQVALSSHIRQHVACEPREPHFEDLISPAKLELIRKKTPNKDFKECWYDIYKILWPGDPLPDSPYVDDETCSKSAVLQDLRAFVRTEARASLIQMLQQGLTQAYLSGPNGIHLVDALAEEAANYFLAILDARLGEQTQQSTDAPTHATPQMNHSDLSMDSTPPSLTTTHELSYDVGSTSQVPPNSLALSDAEFKHLLEEFINSGMVEGMDGDTN